MRRVIEIEGKYYGFEDALNADRETMRRIVHKLLTGDDLRVRDDHDEDLVDAIEGVLKEKHVLFDGLYDYFDYGVKVADDLIVTVLSQKMFPESDDILELWAEREGKPYAQAFEAAKASYRRELPQYTENSDAGWVAMRRLVSGLEVSGYRGHYSTAPLLCGCSFHGNVAYQWRYAKTLVHAVSKASIEPLWQVNWEKLAELEDWMVSKDGSTNIVAIG